MEIENDYMMLPSEDGRFALVLQARKTDVNEPFIVYAKGKHGILYRNANKLEDAVVLDYLAEEAQKLMAENKRAIVIEMDGETVVRDYIVKIELRDKLPVDLKEKKEK